MVSWCVSNPIKIPAARRPALSSLSATADVTQTPGSWLLFRAQEESEIESISTHPAPSLNAILLGASPECSIQAPTLWPPTTEPAADPHSLPGNWKWKWWLPAEIPRPPPSRASICRRAPPPAEFPWRAVFHPTLRNQP